MQIDLEVQTLDDDFLENSFPSYCIIWKEQYLNQIYEALVNDDVEAVILAMQILD